MKELNLPCPFSSPSLLLLGWVIQQEKKLKANESEDGSGTTTWPTNGAVFLGCTLVHFPLYWVEIRNRRCLLLDMLCAGSSSDSWFSLFLESQRSLGRVWSWARVWPVGVCRFPEWMILELHCLDSFKFPPGKASIQVSSASSLCLVFYHQFCPLWDKSEKGFKGTAPMTAECYCSIVWLDIAGHIGRPGRWKVLRAQWLARDNVLCCPWCIFGAKLLYPGIPQEFQLLASWSPILSDRLTVSPSLTK